jgi:2-oxoglutarate dehydrogenase E2 component (dihydrolipoamide succinyltransferase)
MQMRKDLGEQFEKANGIKLGFMSFFAKAAANALAAPPGSQRLGRRQRRDLPRLRRHLDRRLDRQGPGHAGPAQRRSAWASPKSKRASPVTRRAAREGGLKLEDLQGGTFTITNGGTFGSLMSTPIVNPPQSAILGMHAIKERPIVETASVVAAPMMYIALSYDHRIIDGKDAVLFLVDIKNQLENPHRMLLGM